MEVRKVPGRHESASLDAAAQGRRSPTEDLRSARSAQAATPWPALPRRPLIEENWMLTTDRTNEPLTDPLTTEPAAPPAPPSFADYDIHADIVASLADIGITTTFPIQAMTLPVALSGHDIIGQAKTGTGKTLGFGIPALQRVVGQDDPGYEKLAVPGAPQALVIVPTRELAVQVANDLQTASRKRNARIATIYGGRAYEPQVEALKKGVEVVVGTPGRLIDLAQQGLLRLGEVRTLVLDEADEMLDLGFLPDVEKIVRLVPAGRQ